MRMQKIFVQLRFLPVFLWNFILYFLAFFFGLLFTKGDLYFSLLLYLLIGAMSRFWTDHPLLTILPSGIAFPFGYAIFASSMYVNDTNGKSTASFWSTLELMGRDGIETVILLTIVAGVGWLAARYFFGERRIAWLQRAKFYVLFFSIGAVVAYFIFVMFAR